MDSKELFVGLLSRSFTGPVQLSGKANGLYYDLVLQFFLDRMRHARGMAMERG